MTSRLDANRLLSGAAGRLLLRPWFDRAALACLSRGYFPLSRAWAAAAASEGDLDRFRSEIGAARPAHRLLAEKAVAATARRQHRYREAESAFQAEAFGGGPGDPGELARLVDRRSLAAHRFMAARSHFLPLHLVRPIPPVVPEIAAPDAVLATYGDRLSGVAPLWPLPSTAPVERSRGFEAQGVRTSWVRFRSPILGDACLARVEEPTAIPVRATLVFLHGVCIETEFWRGLVDPWRPFVRRGLRVVRPEAPWHGRRRVAGRYGGEPALGRGPLGLAQLFEAWVAETAILLCHLRGTFSGPLALGGISLGALTAQLLLAAAADWPAACAPDAALLVATSGAPEEMADPGSLARALGLVAELRAAGWDDEAFRAIRPLLAPVGRPVVRPDRLVMLLGSADRLVPFGGGAALARCWQVPDANLFVRPQGHFTVSIGLLSAPEPVERLLALLEKTR